MKYIVDKFAHIGLNQVSFSESYIYDICEAEGITVLERDVDNSFYLRIDDHHFIFLNQRLRGIRKLYSLLHELGHYFLHSTTDLNTAFKVGRKRNKAEAEADAFAAVALIPAKRLTDHDILNESPRRFARKLYNERHTLRRLYDI